MSLPLQSRLRLVVRRNRRSFQGDFMDEVKSLMDFGFLYRVEMSLFGQIIPEPIIYYAGLICLVISIIITSFLIEFVIKKWWWKSGIGFQVNFLLTKHFHKNSVE